MTETLERVHPICGALDAARAVVAGVGEVDPLYMRSADQVEALLAIGVVEAQVAELKARLIVAMDGPGGVAEEAGAKDLAAWLDQATRVGVRASREEIAFAHRLSTHPRVAGAMRAGTVSQPQAVVIIRAVEALPDDLDFDLPADTADRAECQLIADASSFDPRGLRVLGTRILEAVAPDLADAAEAAKLEAAERRARESCRLNLRRIGDGTTRISGRIPNLYAAQLAIMLGALLNPRRTPSWVEAGSTESASSTESDESGNADDRGPPAGPWWALPAPSKLGHAFCELLDRINPADLPVHGTTATTLFITIPLGRLESGLGAATILGDGGTDRISASEARRLACNSALIPAVLGTKSEVLDLGRSSRLFTAAQKRALILAHPTCQAEGCRRPASQSEVHHDQPWAEGGRTDLADGIVFCVHHHHLAHDAQFTYRRRPDGVVTFMRQAAA